MLLIDSSCYQAMLTHLQVVYPEEGCGLLAGLNGRVTHHYSITNSDRSATTFLMDSHEQITTMIAIEDQGLELLAVYHSHPHSEAFPSPTDIANSFYPDLVNLILSFKIPQQPVMKGFYIQNQKVIPVQLAVTAVN